MTRPKLYGIKNCDTMKKARRWLDDNDIAYDFHDYKTSGITRKDLKTWVADVGWETLLNRRGTTWRKLPEDTRDSVNQTTAIALMVEQPSMIKRPVLLHNGELTVGFNAEVYEQTLL